MKMGITDGTGKSAWKTPPESDEARRKRLHKDTPLPTPRKNPNLSKKKKELAS
jgi:hypothetical protein